MEINNLPMKKYLIKIKIWCLSHCECLPLNLRSMFLSNQTFFSLGSSQRPTHLWNYYKKSPGFPYFNILLLTMPMVASYSENSSILILLGQSRIHGGICYYPFSQVSECDTVFISYHHVLVSQWFSGWNILWGSNDISILILDKVNKKSISNSTPFLICMYPKISDEVEVTGYMWPRFSSVTS